jgi:hypothetical protein
VVLKVFFCPEPRETRWSSLAATVNWSHLLSWSLSSPMGPYLAPLQPSLDPSPCWALLRQWPKSRSSALSDLDCPLIHQQKIWLRAPTACAAEQRHCCLWGNCMVWFGILDCPVFLSWSLPVLLVANTPVTAVSCVVVSMAKTLSMT